MPVVAILASTSVPLRVRARKFCGKLCKIPIVHGAYSGYLRHWQRRTIDAEQAEYNQLAIRMGLEQDWCFEETQRHLLTRLSTRGIRPAPKRKDQIHVVYAGGHSPWDSINIVPGLRACATVTPYLFSEHGFDHDDPDWVHLRDRMNEHFVDFVARTHRVKPLDLVLTYYSGHQVSPEAIQKINAMGIVTAAYHLDDRLYFRGQRLGGRWRGPAAVAAAYDINLTQAPESLVKYRAEGGIPFLWPLAANPELCFPRDVPFRHNVSFVGTAYGNRIRVIEYLRRHGIDVATFGQGWPGGFLPADRFQEIYCASRINLNFDDIGHTDYQCGKIRDFEVPMCGGLMLSTHNEHLGDYFELDAEIFTFRSPQECLRQIHRLLGNKELCNTACKRARATALREHTWQVRARLLLQLIGFVPEDAAG